MTPSINNSSKKNHLLTGVCTTVLVSAFACAVFAASDSSNDGIGGSFIPSVQTEFFTLADTYQTTDSGVSSGKHIQIQSDDSGEESGGNVSKQNAELNARLQLETGHIYDATKSLNALLAQNPNDAQLLGFTANAENYGGNWPYATYLLNQAHAIAPENQDITELLKEVRREHAQDVEADFDWIKYGHSLEDVSALSGMVNAGPHWQIGADVKDNEVQGRGVRLSDGYNGDKDQSKQQGELYTQYSWQNGQIVKASLFGNNEKAGGGLYYNFLNPLGETQLVGEYQRPYWDMPEAVLDDAVRDRIAFLHVIKPTTHLTIEGGAGWNQYNVDGTDDAIGSITADFNVLYRIIDQVKYHSPYVDLGYNTDAEFTRTAKFSIDSDGDNTRILPLNSRDIQTPFVELGEDLTPSTYGDIAAGYQWDLLGGSGPMVEGKITHELTNMFDVQLRASYGLDTTQSENNITTVGGYLRCRF